MSGRGVITSRTSVSPKSTMLWSSWRSSLLMMPSCSAVSMYALAASFASSAASSGVGHRAAAPGARHRPGDPARHRAERPADRRERRQQHFEDPFRIAADDGQRQEELEDEHEGGDRQADNRERAGAVDADRARQQRGGRPGHQAEQQPHRDEQQQRIVEIRAEATRPVGPLRGEAQGQPHQGAERRFNRAEVDGGAGEQKDAQRDHRRAWLPSACLRAVSCTLDQRLRAGRLCRRSRRSTPQHPRRCPARDRSRGGAAGRAAPGPELGQFRVARFARLAPGDASRDDDVSQEGTQGCGLHAVASARDESLRRKAQDVGRVVLAAVRAVERADASVADERDADDAACAGRGDAGQPRTRGRPRERGARAHRRCGHEAGRIVDRLRAYCSTLVARAFDTLTLVPARSRDDGLTTATSTPVELAARGRRAERESRDASTDGRRCRS